MRAQDIIRAVLDLIDQSDKAQQADVVIDVEPEQGEPVTSRFKQILSILNNKSSSTLQNTPTEVVTNIDTVTTNAGGGLNGPKHPADIRVKDPRGYE